MADNAGLSAVAWALTYLAHSSALAGAAWLADRRLLPPGAIAAREAMWKTALLAGLLTATLQTSGAFIPLTGTVVLHSPSALGLTSFDGPVAVGPSGPGGMMTLPRLRAAAAAFLVLWAAAAIACGLRRFTALVLLRRLLAGRRELRRGALRTALNVLERRTAPATRVRLTCSRHVGVPIVVGRSEICVPMRALRELDVGEQQALLGHELAHVIRRDPHWMTVAMIVESVLIFQPWTRLVRRRLRELSELACDEWAASHTSGALPLARCLVKVAAWNDPGVGAVWVSPFAARRGALTERVERLVEAPRAPDLRGSIALAWALASVAMVSALVPSVVVSPAIGVTSGSVTLAVGSQPEPAPIGLPTATGAAPRTPSPPPDRLATRQRATSRASERSVEVRSAEAPRDRGDGPAETGQRWTDGPTEAGGSPADTPAERAPADAAGSTQAPRDGASPIRDALARFSMPPVDAAPRTREREPLFREAGWERKARMWAASEHRSLSLMPGRPQR